MTLRLRFLQTNAPESMKRGLIKDRLTRARLVERFTIRRRIDVRTINEGGTYAEQVDAETPARKVLWAKANDLVKGRLIGNGIDANRLRFKARLLPDIVTGSGEDAIHTAVAQITHRRSGFTWKHYAPHKPTKRAGNKGLRPIVDQQLREATKRDDAADMPWIVSGDMNGSLNLPNGVVLADHGPDSIIGSRKHFERLGQSVVGRPLLSDHHFLIADVAVEV